MPVARGPSLARGSRSPVRGGASSSALALASATLPTASSFGEVSAALSELRERGLVQSRAWLAELHLALLARFPSAAASASGSATAGGAAPRGARGAGTSRERAREAARESCVLEAARAWFATREYARAARALEKESSDVALFLRLYALFLDAQRGEPVHGAHDPRLQRVRDAIRAREAASAPLDGFLLYLRGAVERRLGLAAEAKNSLVLSVRRMPWNWGAWLEMSRLVKSVAEARALGIPAHFMGTLFLAHVCNETDHLEEAKALYERVAEMLPSWHFAQGQRALVLYNMRMFDEAQVIYEQVFEEDPVRLEGTDIYSNILFVKEDKAQLSFLANRCQEIDKFRLETCCVIGNYFSLRQEHEQAVVYFQRALKLNREYLSAWTLMGHEYVEMKNTAAAVEAYRRAVDINPKDFRAWYGLGQTYELMQMPTFTLYYFRKAAALRPRDARMWCAVGSTLEELQRYDDATRCYERAVRCDDPEGVALQKLANLHELLANVALEEHNDDEARERHYALAATYYSATLERRDEEGLGGADTAHALKFLAKYAVEMDDQDAAEKFCERLMEFHGSKDFAQNLLRQMHGHGKRPGNA